VPHSTPLTNGFNGLPLNSYHTDDSDGSSITADPRRKRRELTSGPIRGRMNAAPDDDEIEVETQRERVAVIGNSSEYAVSNLAYTAKAVSEKNEAPPDLFAIPPGESPAVHSHEPQDYEASKPTGYIQAVKKFGHACIYNNDLKQTFGKQNNIEFLSNINGQIEVLYFGMHLLSDIETTRQNMQATRQRLDLLSQSVDHCDFGSSDRPGRFLSITDVSTRHRLQQMQELKRQERVQSERFQYLDNIQQSFQLRLQTDFKKASIEWVDSLSRAVPLRFKAAISKHVENVQTKFWRLATTVPLRQRIQNGVGVCALINPIPFIVPLLAGEKIYHALSVGQIATTCIQAAGLMRRPTADAAAWRTFAYRRGFISNVNTGIFIPTTVVPFALEKAGFQKAAEMIHGWGFKYSIPAGLILVACLLAVDFKLWPKVKEKCADLKHGKEDFSALYRQLLEPHLINKKNDAQKLRELYELANLYETELADIRGDFTAGGQKISDLVSMQVTETLEALAQLKTEIDHVLPMSDTHKLAALVEQAEEAALDNLAGKVQVRAQRYEANKACAGREMFTAPNLLSPSAAQQQDPYVSINLNDIQPAHAREIQGVESPAAGPHLMQMASDAVSTRIEAIKNTVAPAFNHSLDRLTSPEFIDLIPDQARIQFESWLVKHRDGIEAHKKVDKQRGPKSMIVGNQVLIGGTATYSVMEGNKIGVGAVDFGADATALFIIFAHAAVKFGVSAQDLMTMMKDYNGISITMPFALLPNKKYEVIQHTKAGYYGAMAYFSIAASTFVGPLMDLMIDFMNKGFDDVNQLNQQFKRISASAAERISRPLRALMPHQQAMNRD
jgi:hypothetical protein